VVVVQSQLSSRRPFPTWKRTELTPRREERRREEEEEVEEERVER